MIYCLNPDCPKPENPDNAKFCINCGTKLLLKERYRAIEPLGRGGSSKTFEAVDQDRLNHPCVIKLFMLPPDQDQKATELLIKKQCDCMNWANMTKFQNYVPILNKII